MAQPLKLVVVGDGAIGKTCLLAAFTTGCFPETHVPTIFDNSSRTMMVDGRGCLLNMWDTAGQEDYDRMRPISYPGTDVFLVCFSIDSQTSFDNVRTKWIPEIRTHANKVPFILVGLKSDMRTDQSKSVVSSEDGDKLKNEIRGSKYVECSAKTQEGIKQVFEEAVRTVFRDVKRQKKSGACRIL